MTARPDPATAKLLDAFVRVRIIQMGGVDLSVFQFDPFLSWSVFFMRHDRTIYGRYGSASPRTKKAKKDSNPNHTIAGLHAAMGRALELHAAVADSADLRAALAAKTGPAPPWPTIEATPQAQRYKRLRRMKGAEPKGCAHCHEVQRAMIDSYFMTGQELPDRMLWVYPSPAVLGLTLSLDHCARVTAVRKGSFAALAGVRTGDDLVSLGGQPLVSIADVSWVLHNFGDAGGELPVEVVRSGKPVARKMQLPPFWRRAEDFGWRYRVAGYAMWMWAGVTLADHRLGVRVAQPSPWWFKKPNRGAQKALQKGDVILTVDGRRGWTRSTLLAYLMREKELGAEVVLQILRRGREMEVAFRVPKTRPEVLGH